MKRRPVTFHEKGTSCAVAGLCSYANVLLWLLWAECGYEVVATWHGFACVICGAVAVGLFFWTIVHAVDNGIEVSSQEAGE